jgi:type II secretory pathway pseudopilin PulG
MPIDKRHPESGFTMIATMLAMSLIMVLGVVTVAAVNGDTSVSRRDLDQKQAYEAAKAGINDYAFHLSSDKSYWAKCTTVASPNAVNQKGSTTKQRAVPGSTGATYAIELLPSASQSTYTQCSTVNPTLSMLESSGSFPGSFRIRSTGFSGKAKASIVATFKPPSFLDYLYFTQLETSDPVTYGYANPSSALTGAYKQCTLTWQEGRYNSAIPGTNGNDYCNKISFAGGDTIEGPLHTNDAIAINGNPSFGRNSLDAIEVSATSPGWYATSWGSSPTFVGTFVTGAPTLLPPEDNSEIKNVAQSTFKYTGQVRICLSGTSMTVGTGSSCTGKYSGAIPSNGVVYVSNGECSTSYSPFTATYPTTSGCGNAYVSGSYSGQLTIAAENDIIINGSLARSGEGLLGLVANNFVRIYHPFCTAVSGTPTCTTTTAQSSNGDCNGGENGTGTLSSPEIDAAILAINHSFIVDHYNCGAPMGSLTVEGAIAQKFRGPVGTGNGTSVSTGFSKKYVYDDRLRYLEPPSFIAPKEQTWVIGRETLD